MEKQPFTVMLSAQEYYRLGEPVIVGFEIKNTGNESCQVLKWGTPLEGQITEDCLMVERNGEPIRYDGKRVHRGNPPEDAYVVIGPGEGVSETIDISKVYAIDRAGDYSVTLKAGFFDAFQLPDERKQPPHIQRDFKSHKFPTATVRFTVLEDREPKLTEGETIRRMSRQRTS